uniref:Uncharacterized protein n=1 Tax=Ditylenchus dipsaci TaxID=166011 RepID=A0A915CRX3_9BILA
MPDQFRVQPVVGVIVSPPPACSPDHSETQETGRSRRQSPIAVELQSIADDESKGSSFDMFREIDEDGGNSDGILMSTYFTPKLGFFGAPACRWTSSVMSLVGMMCGMVIAVTGICILLFFVDEEPTIMPLGFTLLVVGVLMLILGMLMWMSEFMCNDCLGKCHQKMKEAPMKNAIKRRSRMASRATNTTNSTRAGSRLSEVSYRTNGGSSTKTAVPTTKY